VIVSRVFDPLSADVAEMIESSTKAHMIGCNENAVQYAIKKAKVFFLFFFLFLFFLLRN